RQTSPARERGDLARHADLRNVCHARRRDGETEEPTRKVLACLARLDRGPPWRLERLPTLRPRRPQDDGLRLGQIHNDATRLASAKKGVNLLASRVGIAHMLQWSVSPRSQPINARIKRPVSRRSVFARRCSRETGTLVG